MIRNPLYPHRYLGFEFLSLRHYLSKKPRNAGLFGFRDLIIPSQLPICILKGSFERETSRDTARTRRPGH